jgi:arsenate reductase
LIYSGTVKLKEVSRMREKIRVLFICGQNSARSQIGEAFLNMLGGDRFEAESAGLEPGPGVNPLAVEVMKEIGVDISENAVNSIMEFFEEGRTYDYVVAVCDEAKAARCPIFPGQHEKINWPFDDIGAFKGEWDEMVARSRTVRDQIKAAVEEFIEEHQ